MHAFQGLPVSVGIEAAEDTDTDLLVVPVFEQDDPGGVPGLDRATAGEWPQILGSREITGKPFETALVPVAAGTWKARRVLLMGAGPRPQFDASGVRRLAAAAALFARQRRAARLALLVRGVEDARSAIGLRAPARIIQAATEGLTLGQLEPALHRTGEPERIPLTEARIVVPHPGPADPVWLAAVERGRVLGECTNDARLLGNEPSNLLTPRTLADRAAALASDAGVTVDVLDEARLAELGMGLLLGVARGSDEPPRLIVLRHDPPDARSGVVLGLVGKGITFDTGGISIKPADGMDRMKVDMGGGAAVIAALRAIARLRVPLRVIGVVPATENMPSGSAVKPGDILRSASGKTVEVLNTDAEGRLVLGDALWYAREQGATHLVDVATLTGACVVALGRIVSGLVGTPDRWVERVRTAAEIAGERAWPLPAYDEYFEQLKSEWADMTNTGGRPAGAITGALFVKQFAGDVPWAHLDIAGTVWAEDAKPWQPKGATGVAVRTLVELALAAEEWSGD